MTRDKPLIYVAHPYGGNETNKRKVDFGLLRHKCFQKAET